MKRNIKTATIISYVTLIIGNVVSIVYTPFMLKKLGESQYGLFSLVNTIISYIYLLDMGLGNAIIRYNSKYISEKDEKSLERVNGMFLVLYFIIALIGLVVGIVLYINLGTVFVKGLNGSEIIDLKRMFIIAIVNIMFAFPFNVFNGIIMANERFTFVKSLAFVRTILNPIVMISILVLGYKAFGMILGSTILNISLGFVNVWYCLKVLKVKFEFGRFNKKLCYEIFRFSFYVFLAAIAYKIYWSTDQIILGIYVSSSAIAVYSIGAQFNGYFTSFSNVISNMFLPQLTKMNIIKSDTNQAMNILLKVSRIQFYIASLILGGFILVGRDFIIRWAGNNYELAYIIALIIMIPQIFSVTQTIFATFLESVNKHKVKSLIYLSVALLNLILTLIFVKVWGGIGCAIGTAIGSIVNSILNNLYYNYKIKLDMKFYWNQIGKLFVVAIISIGVGYLSIRNINGSNYLGIAIKAIIFVIEYFVICWIGVFNEYEKNIFLRYIYKLPIYKKIKKLES